MMNQAESFWKNISIQNQSDIFKSYSNSKSASKLTFSIFYIYFAKDSFFKSVLLRLGKLDKFKVSENFVRK